VHRDLEYEFSEDKRVSPWIMGTLKPIQLSHFDFEGYLAARKQFTTDEWIDLLMQSIGFNPEMFGTPQQVAAAGPPDPVLRAQLQPDRAGPEGHRQVAHLLRVLAARHPAVRRRGDGAKLFVNNATGKIGLVGYWDCVAFDEFAGKQKRVDKALVDILKNYMANKTFSRGIETLGAEASMAFVGNTQHTVPYMLKHSDLFDPCPRSSTTRPSSTACISISRAGRSTSSGARCSPRATASWSITWPKILRYLRNQDYSDRYQDHFTCRRTSRHVTAMASTRRSRA
jgi:ATP-dependent Lon protease